MAPVIRGDFRRSPLRRAERWLFAPGDPRRLAALRIGLFGVLAARLATGRFLEVAGQPEALYRPLSFMKLLDAMPPREVVLPILVIGVVAAVAAALGLLPRLSMSTAWLCGVFLNGMMTSRGKVVHNDVLLLLCIFPLLASPAADAWSVRRKLRPEAGASFGWPVRTAILVVVGAYFFAGLAKLINSGPEWFTSDNLRWVLYASSDSQRVPNALGLFIADRPPLARVMAAGSFFLELGFPLALVNPWLRRLFVAGVVGLHVGIWLMMRLDYFAQIATVLIVMIDWPSVPRSVHALRLGQWKSSSSSTTTTAASAGGR